jgi:dTDP-4-dehydrorhamnose reductase
VERVLITGASGFLGSHLGVHLALSGMDVLGLYYSNTSSLPFASRQVDLISQREMLMLADVFSPSAIVHCAALSRVLDCERKPEEAQRVNVIGTSNVAELARACKAHLIFLSTDQVFDGQAPFRKEDQALCPTHEYGRCKVTAECLVQNVPSSLVLRSNNIVGRSSGWGSSFTDGILERLRRGEPVNLFRDQFRSPIHVRVMVDVIRRSIEERRSGVLHAGGPERLSRFETGIALARAYDFPDKHIVPVSVSSHPEQALLHREGSFDTSLLRSHWQELANEPIMVGLKRDACEQCDE